MFRSEDDLEGFDPDLNEFLDGYVEEAEQPMYEGENEWNE